MSHLVVMVVPMAFQLKLIDPTETDWRLDDHTREVGRRGLARARAALRRTRPVQLAAQDDQPSAA